MDLWHCNATGVYSGVAASGNGNSDDLTNLDATFLRGIIQTDVNGVAQYESIVPGHYTSRKTPIQSSLHSTTQLTSRVQQAPPTSTS
jgi:protocatechuate 3,4-dioxygenase beta subunit